MRKTFKKSLGVLLACLMIMSMATVALADGAAITVGTDTGKAGDSVSVSVTLTGDGITNGVFKVTYDASTLTFVSAAMQVGLGSSAAAVTTPGTVSVSFANNGTAVTGTVVTLNFTIAAGATVGDSAVTPSFAAADAEHSLAADALRNASGEVVAATLTAGKVTVEEDEVEILYGDLNDDDEVDLYDEIILSRYNAGWDGYEEDTFNYDAADLNGDDEVDLYDEIILSRYNAGWDGYEDLPLLD